MIPRRAAYGFSEVVFFLSEDGETYLLGIQLYRDMPIMQTFQFSYHIRPVHDSTQKFRRSQVGLQMPSFACRIAV